jgi:hypothetical protein
MLRQSNERRPTLWTSVATALAVAVVLAVTLSARAEESQSRTFKNNLGQEIGRIEQRGNTQQFYGADGRSLGRGERRGDGTTIFFNERGQRTGSSKERR